MKKNIWIMNHYAIGHINEHGGRHYWIAQNLKKDGYNPVVFGCNEQHNTDGCFFEFDGIWKEYFTEEKIPFVTIKASPYMGNGISRIRNMSSFASNLIKTAKQYAKEHGAPDVIYASSVHPLTVLAGEKLAKYFGVHCIGEVRDLWPETLVAYGAIKRDSIFAKILYLGEKYMYKHADAMVFTMEGAPDYIREHQWDKEQGGPIDLRNVFHICNGVDIEQFDKNAKGFIFPDEDLDNPNLFCAVYTGAIKRANNLGLLINAAEYLKDLDNFKICIWGEGNEIPKIEALIKEKGLSDKVVYKGYVEKKYVASIVSRCDLTLMHWERTSVNNYGYDYNKLFDYLAAGKPVFSTIQSGHSLLINENCGIETKGRSPKEISDGIREIYNMSQSERAEWGKRARTAAFNYDFSVLTKKLEKIVENI